MAHQRLEEEAAAAEQASPGGTQPPDPAQGPPLPPADASQAKQQSPAKKEAYNLFEPEFPDLPEDLFQPADNRPMRQESALITDSSPAPDGQTEEAPAASPLPPLPDEAAGWGFSQQAVCEDDPFAAAAPEAGSAPQAEPRPPAAQASETRMGILGGKESGKSYLLHALIYRVQAAAQAGALSPYLRGGQVYVYQADSPDEKPRLSSLHRFIRAYKSWARLAFTERGNQAWYRLALTFRNGLLGSGQSTFQIGFMDSAGEYREMDLSDESSQEWRETFLNVGVMAFCLPLWAAFPTPGLSADDKEKRLRLLSGFEKVVLNYKTLLDGQDSRVRTMLVLTMADDRRGDLPELVDAWILPLLNEPEEHLRQLRRETGVARYILNARKVSESLHEEFRDAEPEIARIPEMLNFGAGAPWIIPVSAIEGATLDSVEQSGLEADVTPVPAHVELPLLLALCESHNALM